MSDIFSKPELLRFSVLALAASTLVLPTFNSTTARAGDLRRFEGLVGQPPSRAVDRSGPIPGCGPRYTYGSDDCGSISGGRSGGPNQT